jgi:hypothetical protein
LLKPPEKAQEYINLKYAVSYYAGMSGYIRGSITINSSYLIFNPNLEDKDNMEKFTSKPAPTQSSACSSSTPSSRSSTSRI